MPVRARATRTPARSAAAVAASHATTTSARNPSPGAAASSSTELPRSPYQPTAEACTSARGPSESLARLRARSEVPCTRDSRTAALWAVLHRRSPTPTPPRLTTTSASSSTSRSISPASGSHERSSGAVAAWRTRRTTESPRARNRATRAPPMRPEDPATTTCTVLTSHPDLVLEGAFLDARLDRREIPRSVRAVDQSVIVGERQEAHRADCDHVGAVGVLDDRGALDDRPRREDRGVADVDDGRVDERTARAGVRDRERRPAQLVGEHLVLPGATGEIDDRLGDPGEVEVPGVLDDGHEQTALGVHRDTHVLLRGVGDLVVLERRVDLRVRLERLDRGEHEERQVGQVDAFALLEARLRLVTHPR